MSGGFFRGTSADQDTRFSNKQAKLMKSQKFAPELDHLVDMGKVKMDVLKPWIATRVTELLGFEDEVLINFIYGLLDGKVVNGKEIQIQITGFMEKNTGKFMKELWVLLLSAEKNASGVPQQFLDAKEEEIRKKKDEADRITSEIQKKRKEAELEKQKKMDVDVDASKAVDDASEKISKHMLPRTDDDKGSGEENGSRENQRHKSRSLSRSPLSRRHSISPERQYRSSRKRSLSPRRNRSPRRPRSPLRRRSPHSRRRSSSRSWRRSPYRARRSLSRDQDVRSNGFESKRYRDDYITQRKNLRVDQNLYQCQGNQVLVKTEEEPREANRERIMHSDGASLVRQTRVGVTRHDSPKTARHEEAGGKELILHTRVLSTHPLLGVQRKIYKEDLHQKKYTREELSGHRSGESRSRLDITEANKNDRDRKSGRSHNNNRVDAFDSDLKGNGKKGPEHLGKRKNKRSEKHDMTSDDASSPILKWTRKKGKREGGRREIVAERREASSREERHRRRKSDAQESSKSSP
ncbi:hypothetical protein GIB67_038065 [Kingdonia uniflora]|uniref:PWI domain-containing protein n=1 Tax=Kingdonia uniflora TaxID=39325 RepID=A0A7J7LL20_9MAGN|nr:hypothetical protein GIB67_038065 [Kingdonia uniflora]